MLFQLLEIKVLELILHSILMPQIQVLFTKTTVMLFPPTMPQTSLSMQASTGRRQRLFTDAIFADMFMKEVLLRQNARLAHHRHLQNQTNHFSLAKANKKAPFSGALVLDFGGHFFEPLQILSG